MAEQVSLTVAQGSASARIDGMRVRFSPHQCFDFDGSDEEAALLRALARHLVAQPALAILGGGPLLGALLELEPRLRACVCASAVPSGAATVFLCETRAVQRWQLRRRVPAGVDVVEPTVLAEIAPDLIPDRAWIPTERNIYPLDVPELEIAPDLDLLVVDCPARNLALMPNGLGYLYNALKRTDVRFQIFDLDIIAYHRFHMRRLYDEPGRIRLPNGREMPADPWQAEHYDLWADENVIAFFLPLVDELAAAIVTARPKVLGLSLQQCNEALSRRLVNRVRESLPDLIVIVGGFSCYNAEIGRRGFPECDYMCIGEADLVIGPLAEALARGERPRDLPGVLSRFDTEQRRFVPGPMPHDLGKIDFPTYPWFPLSIYRNWNDYQLTPIIASRGCRWSRCTFCAERFYWRVREPAEFVDELEWLVERGCTLFMFNESDLNGKPERLLEICEEIIRRDLNIRLTGQLRIHKKSDKHFFQTLRRAGFVALRFGVDAFSENTLRLQMKGYSKEMVSQNLRDCWEAGIFTEVNWVIGVPGETDADVDEGIEFILSNQPWVGRLANFNPLILATGSVYWLDPESHGIHFRGERAELYEKHPRAIPADLWYSTEPYIDAQVRRERFRRIVLALHESGFPVGTWALRVIDDVATGRDPSRATATGTRRLLSELPTHRIYACGGRVFALPSALDADGLSDAELESAPGVVSGANEEEVLAALRRASAWANSRGHYDAREEQRLAGSHMRADAEGGERPLAHLPTGSRIVYAAGEFFAVAASDLERVFQRRRGIGYWLRPSRGREGGASGEPPLSRLRRMARALPEPVQEALRRALRAERKLAGESLTASDLALARRVARRLVLDHVVRPTLARVSGRPRRRRGVPGYDLEILRVRTAGAVPELMRVIGNYNLVQFDGMYYGVPHGVSIDWERDEPAELAGIVATANAAEATARVTALSGWRKKQAVAATTSQAIAGPAGQLSSLPLALGALDGYRLLSYEGVVYGIPETLADVDPRETDLMGLPGVLRDVSRDVVESQISERVALAAMSPAG